MIIKDVISYQIKLIIKLKINKMVSIEILQWMVLGIAAMHEQNTEIENSDRKVDRNLVQTILQNVCSLKEIQE